MSLSPADKIRFAKERDILVDKISDILWDSDLFRELSMNQVPMPGVDEPTDAQMEQHIADCSEKQAEMINVVLITLLQKNNNLMA